MSSKKQATCCRTNIPVGPGIPINQYSCAPGGPTFGSARTSVSNAVADNEADGARRVSSSLGIRHTTSRFPSCNSHRLVQSRQCWALMTRVSASTSGHGQKAHQRLTTGKMMTQFDCHTSSRPTQRKRVYEKSLAYQSRPHHRDKAAELPIKKT